MKVLVRPAAVAFLACLLAASLHPKLHSWLGSSDRASIFVASMALLLSLAFVLRGFRPGLGGRLLGLGVLALVAGAALDGTRAHRGLLSLAEGQTKNNFEEQDADGRALGLRPLGFELRLARVSGSVATLERPQGGAPITVTAAGATRVGPFRFGDPALVPTGQANQITVTVNDEASVRSAEVSPAEPGRVGDLEIELERYFPDFALDEHQQPFSRSPHSRNPAALLRVRRGEKAFRVFVIRSMPGLHQVAELHQSFGLGSVEPEVSVQLQVAEEPGAALLGGAVLLLVAGVLLVREPA